MVGSKARDHREGQTAEYLGNLDADPTGIFARAVPEFGAGVEVMVAGNEVVGGLHQDGPQAAMATAA